MLWYAILIKLSGKRHSFHLLPGVSASTDILHLCSTGRAGPTEEERKKKTKLQYMPKDNMYRKKPGKCLWK